MHVPYIDIHVECGDTPERKVFDLRRDGLSDVPVLGLTSYSHARPDLPVHHHRGVFEIHFLDRGRQVFEVEGQRYELHRPPPPIQLEGTMMTSRKRLLCALRGKQPDRLPVTTHHLMSSFLRHCLDDASPQAFFDRFGLDAIRWVVAHRPEPGKGECFDPSQGPPGFLEARRITSGQWRVVAEDVPGQQYATTRFRFVTPRGELSMVLEANEHTAWVTEHLVKDKSDIDFLGQFMTAPTCDTAAVNAAADDFGERGIVRGHICCLDVFGQPGCWQDAACLVGIERLIMATYDDPGWVHELLGILQRRKLTFTRSLAGARYDLLELGGGDASSTVISPALFDRFVAPYDEPIIAAAHAAGQRIVYHTCGGMMPILERLADLGADALETFTPKGMGGDADLAAAKRRIGDRVCMIGGFDQLHFFTGCTPEQTRAEVRRCFEAAGAGGGFILCPSDHFFTAEPALVAAFADEARQCSYD
jgi:uroporphyrinogen decarboxylase